ncbi:MAG: methyltransferase domain-containing protein [Opitutales bacterium]
MSTVSGKNYDEAFYEANKANSTRSARVVVPMLLQQYRARSVVDLGCGSGAWLSVFKENGVEHIQGYDGPWVEPQSLLIDATEFKATQLPQGVATDHQFDLAMSLEVAEHLQPDASQTFVELLTSLADVVLFSAAIPYQEGMDHINEQWQSFWVEAFERMDFQLVDFFRPALWEDDSVAFWFRQNLFLFLRKRAVAQSEVLQALAATPVRPILNVVHPRLFLPKAQTSAKINRFVPGFLRTAARRLSR